jgi:RNA polymerase sigma factor (sigma-70 family)
MDFGTETAPGTGLGEGAFADLVGRYHALVCAVAYGATGDRALSEDVAQDTFVVAWRGRHTLRDPSRVRQWLCAIARHLALNTRRSRTHDPIEDDAALAADVDLHARLEHAQRDALVWQSIAAIPETYRVALVLYYREDKSVAEVAAALGITEANALQRLSRGRRQLERGIEDLVERSLASSKPDRARRQAVLAAIGADLTPLSADAALEAARVSIESASWKVTIMKVAIAACAVAGVVTLVQWGCAGELDKDQVAAAPRAEDGEVARRVDPDEAREQAQRAELDRAMRAGGTRDVGSGGAMASHLPTYRLSIIDANRVAVNLAGGPSALMGASEALGIDLQPTVREAQRRISGRVLDASGAPVQGAVVIAGSHLTMLLDTSVSADAGDETDARGRFEVSVDADASCAMLALHRDGWSAIEHVAAGTKDTTLDLDLDAPVHVHGIARRGNDEQDGVVLLRDAARNVLWSYPTDDAGKFSIFVPRGAFTLGFRPGERFGSGDPLVRETIDQRAGADLEWNPKVPVGTRLAVDVPLPATDADRVTMIWVGVLPGPTAPKDAAEMRKLAKKNDDVRLLGFGGEDLEEVFEFEDLAPGTYTVCAEAERRQRELTPPPSLAFACREVALKQGEEVHELKMAW